ncbi:hypothetical protein MtrunA17_Chr6g0488011 [Medicago truncatula]|uniref:Uncharacterized protein n=1 Tax=Medicago truncatula TaxID=3880 RepID=A0A396HIH2_MEDTR|nr:hypothetical protein MtrunA17_Chr6g0488011 [Medicago truncatula]
MLQTCQVQNSIEAFAAQVRQSKRELVKLPVNGQDQTTRTQVEHVGREEKTRQHMSLLRYTVNLSQLACP